MNSPSRSPGGSIISVDIRKRRIGRLGFLVRERESKPVLCISDIIKGGAAYDSGVVRIGDIVLKVNSTNLSDLPYRDALHVLRAVKEGEIASLLLRVPEGYTARLETTFDQNGKAKTVRITESTMDSKMTGKANVDPSTENSSSHVTLHEKGIFSSGSQTTTGPSCSCLSASDQTIATQPLPPIRRKDDPKDQATPVIQGEPKSNLKSRSEPYSSSTNESQASEHSVNGTVESSQTRNSDDVVDGTIVARPLVRNSQLIVNEMPRETKLPAPFSPSPSLTNEQLTFHTLRNWETGQRINDNLFAKSKATTGCSHSKCIGSVMNPDFMTADPRKNVRTKEQKLELATDFIKQYYGSMKRKNPEMEKKRLAEVVHSIEEKGTYELTEYELIFGAKTAWRNAPRCIGRIQWNKLQVFDYRHVDNTTQMFDAICNHLKYATNKGNIRSCITFFPQRTDYKKDFRVWSSQFIRYAGYRQPDDSIVGDPANVEFTELCINLGWQPKGGRFDILPLVLQANGEDPDLFDLPKHLALEVKLRHPRFDWFERLGYKWAAVPAVSNILLDIGGIEFPAAPFNGWFMGTEVARDLCDVSRYNVLEEVAQKMDLNTKNLSSLWKDLALVEFNIAVLYSFQADNVTIMDHHSATQSFMKHFANEMKARGGCPGDWVWLTPPISGSLTPIFHQEILNYSLSPSCQYQPDPQKYHVWKGKKLNKLNKGIKFKQVAKSVLALSSMMGKAMANRVKATILYATETGKSLEYAKSLRDIFNHAFSAKVVCMEDYDVGNLEYETLLLIVTSTFGNGDPPENGVSLAEALLDLSKSEDGGADDEAKATNFTSIHNVSQRSPRIQRQASAASISSSHIAEAAGFLSNLRFSVFGLGSRAYPHFCAFAHVIDTLLGELKGERLLQIGEGDELCGQEEEFRTWAQKVFKTACETFCVGNDVSSEAASASLMGQDRSWSPNKFRISADVEELEELEIVEGLSKFHRKKIAACTVLKQSNLQSGEDNRSTILVELELGSESSDAEKINYESGDHIGIYPCNQPELVDRILARLINSTGENELIQLQMFQQRTTPLGVIANWVPDERLPVCTLRIAFERYLDITTCLSPLMLKLFADCATDEKEKARLLMLSKGKTDYDDWKFHCIPNLPEILDEFPSVSVEASLLLSQLPPLQSRYYSISSSPSVHPGKVHCTVAVVSYKTQGGAGQTHYGVCSSYLNRVPAGTEICAFIRPAVDFRLPKNPTDPILLIGPGTGIAPFRSFWQQRIYEIRQGQNCGEMALLFGCRHPDRDQLYREEIEEAKNSGAITRYETVFSRLPGQKKQYVQHVLKTNMADLACEWLVQRRGHVYICGDVTMADDVNKAIVEVFQQKMKMTEKAAKNHISRMKDQHLFHEDIFGVTLRTYEVNKSVRQKHAARGDKK